MQSHYRGRENKHTYDRLADLPRYHSAPPSQRVGLIQIGLEKVKGYGHDDGRVLLRGDLAFGRALESGCPPAVLH